MKGRKSLQISCLQSVGLLNSAQRDWLPSGCSYTPSDIVDRGEGTIVCDLNGPDLLPLSGYDVRVFSGVLEYVNDLGRLVKHLSDSRVCVVASYATKDRNRFDRLSAGWVNAYSREEILPLFKRYEFENDLEQMWRRQHLFRLVMR
jgi:hypothetical protein